MREELVGTKSARRLDVATRGNVAADGSLRLDVVRAGLERRRADGTTTSTTTAVVAADPNAHDAADEPTVRLLESLRTKTIRVGLDATDGVTSVEGVDAALDAAVRGDPSLGGTRAGLRVLCSDEGWRDALAAAGLCVVPAAVRDGGTARRDARVVVPGRGATSMRLDGTAGRDDGGMQAVHLAGSLAADASFEGAPGAPPPDEVGPVRVADVTGDATTSYSADDGPPFKGQWSLVLAFERGATVRRTTTFTLVRR